ncbi:MAG: hypothetical protein FWD58_07090 [Firmicutes bacterium]|nr:hypothetical protein [Bacillota bacterium]
MSNFIGTINGNIATYAVIKRTGGFGGENMYTLTDDAGNVMVFETDKMLEYADGGHYFLIEGKVKEHKTLGRARQTVLSECDFELIDSTDKIIGSLFGKIGDVVELDNVTASYRKVSGTEWLINGEFAVTAPVSEYRLVVAKADYTFLLPFDSAKKLSLKSTGRFNLKAKVIGYTIEKNARATFLYPVSVEDKNGSLHGGWMWHGFLR